MIDIICNMMIDELLWNLVEGRVDKKPTKGWRIVEIQSWMIRRPTWTTVMIHLRRQQKTGIHARKSTKRKSAKKLCTAYNWRTFRLIVIYSHKHVNCNLHFSICPPGNFNNHVEDILVRISKQWHIMERWYNSFRSTWKNNNIQLVTE